MDVPHRRPCPPRRCDQPHARGRGGRRPRAAEQGGAGHGRCGQEQPYQHPVPRVVAVVREDQQEHQHGTRDGGRPPAICEGPPPTPPPHERQRQKEKCDRRCAEAAGEAQARRCPRLGSQSRKVLLGVQGAHVHQRPEPSRSERSRDHDHGQYRRGRHRARDEPPRLASRSPPCQDHSEHEEWGERRSDQRCAGHRHHSRGEARAPAS